MISSGNCGPQSKRQIAPKYLCSSMAITSRLTEPHGGQHRSLMMSDSPAHRSSSAGQVQGGLLKYTVDENNVEWAVPHLKEFLIDVTRHSGAESVNLIAHSMGNQALTGALRELQLQLGEETALFNQIILAAPDVDAEIFRRDLAPALVQSARRVTLYASSNDQALVASKKVHGHARAGDSGAGLVVVPGIETIDVSTLDTSLLGHSYYGSSDPILLDIRGIDSRSAACGAAPVLAATLLRWIDLLGL